MLFHIIADSFCSGCKLGFCIACIRKCTTVGCDSTPRIGAGLQYIAIAHGRNYVGSLNYVQPVQVLLPAEVDLGAKAVGR